MDCCGGISFTDDDELESDLALGGVGPSSSSSSSITIGELRDPMPTMAMMDEWKGVVRSVCLARNQLTSGVLPYVISVLPLPVKNDSKSWSLLNKERQIYCDLDCSDSAPPVR
jgi:hypothetical protein